MTYEYRIIEKVYRNRVEYEDGPGSLTNIVSDELPNRELKRWTSMSEEFGDEILKDGVKRWECMLRASDPDGRVDRSYWLERRVSGSNEEWRFLGTVRSNTSSDGDSFQDELREQNERYLEDHRWDYLEERDEDE
jgi:hypothetical protein